MSKKHKVTIPEGYEVDSVKSFSPVDCNIINANLKAYNNGNQWIETTVRFKLIKKGLPKTWESDLSIILQEIKITTFARKIGMNESLLRKYKVGIVKPSSKQLKRIEAGIHELGQELMKVKMYYG